VIPIGPLPPTPGKKKGKRKKGKKKKKRNRLPTSESRGTKIQSQIFAHFFCIGGQP